MFIQMYLVAVENLRGIFGTRNRWNVVSMDLVAPNM